MALRIFRAILGVLGLIMLKASIQPGYEYFFEGEATSFVTAAWRLLVGVAAISAFSGFVRASTALTWRLELKSHRFALYGTCKRSAHP